MILIVGRRVSFASVGVEEGITDGAEVGRPVGYWVGRSVGDWVGESASSASVNSEGEMSNVNWINCSSSSPA